MRIILLTSLILFATCYSFDDYTSEFNKSYSNQEEKTLRENVFQQNMDTYQAINSNYKGYSVGPTAWTDRTD